ncbi:hypothetical protein REPUB_Repub10bG0098500 [Reevesia pubescens]
MDRLRLQGSDEEVDHGVVVEDDVHGEKVEEVDPIRKTLPAQLENMNDRGLMRFRCKECAFGDNNAVVEKMRQISEVQEGVKVDTYFKATPLKSLAEACQLEEVKTIIREGSGLENDEQIELGNVIPIVGNIVCSSPNGFHENHLGNLNLVVDLTQFVFNKDTNGLGIGEANSPNILSRAHESKNGNNSILDKGEYSMVSNEFEIHGTKMEFHSKSLGMGTKKASKNKKRWVKSLADVEEVILDKVDRKCQRRGRKHRNCFKAVQSKEGSFESFIWESEVAPFKDLIKSRWLAATIGVAVLLVRCKAVDRSAIGSGFVDLLELFVSSPWSKKISLNIESDSKLVVSWISNKMLRPWKDWRIFADIDYWSETIGDVQFSHVSRKANSFADSLAKMGDTAVAAATTTVTQKSELVVKAKSEAGLKSSKMVDKGEISGQKEEVEEAELRTLKSPEKGKMGRLGQTSQRVGTLRRERLLVINGGERK